MEKTNRLMLPIFQFIRGLRSTITRNNPKFDSQIYQELWNGTIELFPLLEKVNSELNILKERSDYYKADSEYIRKEWDEQNKEIKLLKEVLAFAAIPLEVLYAVEYDGIALCDDVKEDIKNAVLEIRSVICKKKI